MNWPIDFGNRPWHRWFAWYPVRIRERRYWWEYVMREKENCQGYIITSYRRCDEPCVCTRAEINMFGTPDPLCEAALHGEPAERRE